MALYSKPGSGSVAAALAVALLSLSAIAAGAQDLYVTDYGAYGDPNNNNVANNIKVFSPTGQYINTITGGLNNPSALVFNASGNLLVVNQGVNAITEYSQSGTYLGVFASTGINSAQGIAIDSSGDVYVGNSGSITKYSSTGTYLGVFATSGVGSSVADIAFGPNGDLYSVNQYQDTVSVYAPDGTYLRSMSTGVDPFGLLVDASGNLYVANADSASIQEFNSAGTQINSFSTGVDTTPCGLVFDPAGNLLVANAPYGNVLEYTTGGTYLGVFATGGMDNDYHMSFAPAASTPEPSSLAVFGVGVLAIARKRQRRC